MTRPAHPESKPVRALRTVAMRYPEAEEGTSCAKCAFKARGKAFLFVGMDDSSYNVMLKLRESLAEAAKLAAREPDCCKVGATGWVTTNFRHDQAPPPGLLERWIDESYRLLAHKQLVALLPDRGRSIASGPATAKKKYAKKKATSR